MSKPGVQKGVDGKKDIIYRPKEQRLMIAAKAREVLSAPCPCCGQSMKRNHLATRMGISKGALTKWLDELEEYENEHQLESTI